MIQKLLISAIVWMASIALALLAGDAAVKVHAASPLEALSAAAAVLLVLLAATWRPVWWEGYPLGQRLQASVCGAGAGAAICLLASLLTDVVPVWNYVAAGLIGALLAFIVTRWILYKSFLQFPTEN